MQLIVDTFDPGAEVAPTCNRTPSAHDPARASEAPAPDGDGVPVDTRSACAAGSASALAKAEAAWHSRSTAFAGAAWLKALREGIRAGLVGHTEALASARSVLARHPADGWVWFRYGWLLYDRARTLLDEASLRFGLLVPVLGQLLEVVLHVPESARATFADQAARLLGVTAKLLPKKGARATQKACAATLLDRWSDRLDVLWPLVSDTAQSFEGRTLPCAREKLLNALRRLAVVSERHEDLRALCLSSLTGARDVADKRWVLHDYVLALTGLDREPDEPDTLERQVAEHGRNEFVHLRLAEWHAQRGRQEQAEEEVRQSLALSHSPWPWERAAELYWRWGRPEIVADLLRAGLGFVPPPDRDAEAFANAWRLHLRLARALRAVGGDLEDIALELALAGAARVVGGWRPDAKLEALRQAGGAAIRTVLERLPQQPAGLHALARDAYRVARRRILVELSRTFRVTSVLTGAKIAFLAPERSSAGTPHQGGPVARGGPRPGADGPAVILARRGEMLDLQAGQLVQGIAVRSWDRKKSRPGTELAWWEPMRASA